MSLEQTLQAAINKNISAFCSNGFTADEINHCAHFVSHMLGIESPYNCRQQTGAREKGANLRVNEVFGLCPKVGTWDTADLHRTQLIFATARKNVDVAARTMRPVSQKHIGIYHQGVVYHYRNREEVVGSNTVDEFRAYFRNIYDGDQELFFGWFPGEDLQLNVSLDGSGVSAAKKFALARTNAGDWLATEAGDGLQFPVGREVSQPGKDYYGIYSKHPAGERFRATQFPELEAWGLLLQVTGECESRNYYNCINTYDRAKFTFGFYQLAAHTPADNFILLFRALAELSDFNDYFPELEMRHGALHRVDSSGSSTNLETALPTGPKDQNQLQHFMNYLNPNRRRIDEQEVLQAARLIHWTNRSQLARDTQVEVAADILQRKLGSRHSRKLPLDGLSATICAVVSDIFHQGRSSYSAVKPLLAAADPLDALLHHKEAQYSNRNHTLRSMITALGPQLDDYVYVSATNEFRKL